MDDEEEFVITLDNSPAALESDVLSRETLSHVHINPLLTYEVLTIISQYLDFKSLQSARVVVPQWNEIFTRQLLQKSYIVVPHSWYIPEEAEGEQRLFDTKTMEKFIETLNRLSIKIPNIKIVRLEDIQVFKNLLLLRENVQELKFLLEDQVSKSFKTRELFRLLEDNNLSSLTTLKIHCLDMFSDTNFWSANDNSNFNKFLQRLELLQTIEVHQLDTDELRHLGSPIWERLKAMKKLRAPSPSIVRAYMGSAIRWNLHRVTVVINWNDPVDLFQNFFNTMASTLTHLNMSFMSTQDTEFEGIPRETWLDNWYLPLTLRSLENLKIWERYAHHEEVPQKATAVWRTVATALQLPKLKKLVLKEVYCGHFDHILRDWKKHQERQFSFRSFMREREGTGDISQLLESWRSRSHGNSNKKKLQSLSIQELQIHCTGSYFDPSYFTSRSFNLWPNLSRLVLHCTLAEPMPTFVNAVFCKMQNHLERLVLYLYQPHLGATRFSGDAELDWNVLLTGIDKSHRGSRGNSFTLGGAEELTRREHSLKDLTKLKILIIHCNHTQLLSDFLIYNVLMELKSIQLLRITGILFSQKAVDDLRAALGPCVSIDMNKVQITTFNQFVNDRLTAHERRRQLLPLPD